MHFVGYLVMQEFLVRSDFGTDILGHLGDMLREVTFLMRLNQEVKPLA